MIYLFKKSWKYAGKERWKIIVFYILHVISHSGEVLQPYAFGRALNALQLNGTGNLRPTLIWLGVYVAGFFIFQIFHHTARYFEWTLTFHNQQQFINDMYNKMYHLPMKWHMNHHSGEIVNRVNTAGLALWNFGFAHYNYLGNLILLVGPIIVLTSFSWKIALIALSLTAINFVIVQRMNLAIQPILHEQNETLHDYSARLIDFVGNIRTIISLRLKNRTADELDKKFFAYFRENMREFWINQPRCFILALGGIITELAVILYYIFNCQYTGQIIMMGTLTTLVNYFKQMRDSVFEISSDFYQVMSWKTALQSVEPIETAASKISAISRVQESLKDWKQLSLRNLQFLYDEGQGALDCSQIDIGNQSKIAIVGLSGSGKSTLLNILAGLYEPEQAQLMIDGNEYSQLNSLTDSALLMPQDSEIFENTIHYNITFGLETTDQDLETVIRVAQLEDVLSRLPHGIQTDVREKGVNLSGGEKQRLALARGLYFARDKKILLLDEITSSLDAFNEKMVFQQIFENYQDRCIISSIHRLHLLEMFDTVLVMDEGRIVQKGNFSQLIRVDGHFKRLWEKYLTGEKAS